MMIIICSWCSRRKIGPGQWVKDWREGDYPVGTVTHGMCEDCYRKNFEGTEQMEGEREG